MSGLVRLVLVINLGRYALDETSADAFRHLRGSQAYADALRSLQPQPPFLLDDETQQLEEAAYALRIFRSRLRFNHFFPTYRVAWDTHVREAVEAELDDAEAWLRWTPRIRLTRNGLAVIMLEQAIEDESLIGCVERVLELRTTSEPGPQGQWKLGFLLLTMFLEALGQQLVIAAHGRAAVTIAFARQPADLPSLRLDRYVIYKARSITCNGELLEADVLKDEYAPTIAALMEGSLVEDASGRRFPRYAADQSRQLAHSDCSSWDEELCLFTGETALLYSPLVQRGIAYVGGPIGLTAHAYGTYWAGIMRGIEHVVAFRAEVQQAERRTTDLLAHVPALTRKVNDGDLKPSDSELINHMAMSLADIFDSLPELRSMAVSSSAFRADYARRKFERLIEVLDIKATLELVNTNVEQLNFFISYYGDMRLQWQAQRTNDSNMLISEIVMFLALSSFAADTLQVSQFVTQNVEVGEQVIIAVIIAFVTVLVIGWARRLAHLRRRQERRLFDR
ncbi:MAG TPA: hypothetical protein VFT99_14320 [Roseiflexaceae bacterium]|nr:hypothetical protein [Roseiflexaceae bacterium]